VRGAGLLLGVVFTEPVAATVVERLAQARFLTNGVQPGVLRLAPPLILTLEQADAFVAALTSIVEGL
jgi:acetylornithine aminotransferase